MTLLRFIPHLLFLLTTTPPPSHAYGDNYTCHFAPSVPEDRRPSPNRLRLVQYNVEFFFLDQSSGGLVCPGTDCPWPDAATAQAHALRVATVLKELRPDIVNLCEVEGCDEMEWLARQLNDAEYEEQVEKGNGGRASKDGFYNYYLLKGQDTFTVGNVEAVCIK
jgi:hypothetical protein